MILKSNGRLASANWRGSGSQSLKSGVISWANVSWSIFLDQDGKGQGVFLFDRSVIEKSTFNFVLDIGYAMICYTSEFFLSRTDKAKGEYGPGFVRGTMREKRSGNLQ